MRNTLVIFFLLCIFESAFSGTTIKSESKKVVLVTSAECGPCITNISFFNQLSLAYKDQIQMIALYESSQKQINALPAMFPGREVVLKNWIVVPDAKKIYMKLIEYETYPQLIFMNDDIVVDRFIGTIDSVKDSIRKQLPLFINE